MLYRFVWCLVKVVYGLMGRPRVEGHERIPATGPVILVSNHLSMADPPFLGGMVRRPVRFMAKEELFRVPLLGSLVRALGTFPVRRGAADRSALRQCLAWLEAGEVVGLFPEGTRSPDGRLQKLEQGIAYIALKSKAPVVPVAIQGTEKLLAPHAKFPRPARLLIRFGPPLAFPEFYGRKDTPDAREQVVSAIRDSIARLLDPPYRPAP
ncbi:MAG: 1-acyl-sn-glycerol-3-phosphate acyltransferase [Armatimonadetes bacterium]|nr:1-acyl-sn-glycerol-3-phosphate acyltransferase [Armatimonadota bacterium]